MTARDRVAARERADNGPALPPDSDPPGVWLRFDDGPVDADHLARELSALAVLGDTLWTAADEGDAVERFTRLPDGSYGAHRRYPLGELLGLPDGGEGEVDIEGVAVDEDGWLWVVGSHSLRRLKPDPDKEKDPDDLVRRLGCVDRQRNRYTLARLPLVRDADGLPAPAAKADDGRKAAVVPFTRHGSRLSRLLKRDAHLSPFVGVPSKENGLDVEGLAVRGGRVFLGLRGPVLRGYAVVLELRPEAKGRKLKLRRLAGLDGSRPRFRKHFLDLRGLGVRDLAFAGDDLLVLAGPTLAHDGRHTVFRWRGALLDADGPTLHGAGQIDNLLDFPIVPDRDRAEGMALLPGRDGGADELLVVYDSPAAARIDRARGAVRADIVRVEL